MYIEDQRMAPFDCLRVGDVFEYESKICLVIPGDARNRAFCISDNALIPFDYDTRVMPISNAVLCLDS